MPARLLLLLLLSLPLLLGAGHQLAGGRCWWGKYMKAACCRLGARKVASDWWRRSVRQSWVEAGEEEGAGARTTKATTMSWRAVYCFAKFWRVYLDNMSHSGWTESSHLYVTKLSHLCPTITAFLYPKPYTAARLSPYVHDTKYFNFPVRKDPIQAGAAQSKVQLQCSVGYTILV